MARWVTTDKTSGTTWEIFGSGVQAPEMEDRAITLDPNFKQQIKPPRTLGAN